MAEVLTENDIDIIGVPVNQDRFPVFSTTKFSNIYKVVKKGTNFLFNKTDNEFRLEYVKLGSGVVQWIFAVTLPAVNTGQLYVFYSHNGVIDMAGSKYSIVAVSDPELGNARDPNTDFIVMPYIRLVFKPDTSVPVQAVLMLQS